MLTSTTRYNVIPFLYDHITLFVGRVEAVAKPTFYSVMSGFVPLPA